MRISTAYFHDQSAASITQRQSEVAETQARLASGKRISTAADDPVGAARASRARSGLAQTGRWMDAQDAARTSLTITESTLGSIYDSVLSARDTVIAAGSPSLSDSDRRTMATQLRQVLDQVVGLANTTEGDGTFLFAGFDNRAAPFVKTGTAVGFVGDGGQRFADLGPGVRVAVTVTGEDAFMRIADGNGVFATAAPSTNTGSGIVNAGRVTAAGALTGHPYTVTFGAGGSTYSVVDATTGTTIQAAQPFTPGATLAFDGLAFEIAGQPAAGDTFDVTPSASSSLFDRLTRAIDLLETPATGAWRAGEIAGILRDLDVAGDHLLEARGAAGNALARLDSLGGIAEDRAVAQTAEVAKIEDLDYAKAATELSKQTLAMQAAMAAYAQGGRKSLFDYL